MNVNDRVRVTYEGSSLFGKEGTITLLVPGGYNVLLDEDSDQGLDGSLWFAVFEVVAA